MTASEMIKTRSPSNQILVELFKRCDFDAFSHRSHASPWRTPDAIFLLTIATMIINRISIGPYEVDLSSGAIRKVKKAFAQFNIFYYVPTDFGVTRAHFSMMGVLILRDAFEYSQPFNSC